MALTAVDSATFPDETGPFVLERVGDAWRVTHHNVEDDEPTAFEFASIPAAMGFLDACGVSRGKRS